SNALKAAASEQELEPEPGLQWPQKTGRLQESWIDAHSARRERDGVNRRLDVCLAGVERNLVHGQGGSRPSDAVRAVQHNPLIKQVQQICIDLKTLAAGHPAVVRDVQTGPGEPRRPTDRATAVVKQWIPVAWNHRNRAADWNAALHE